MNLSTSDVKVISHEIVEDRNPELYVERAKEYVKKGMYAEAEKEYDKAIEYSGKKHSFYLEKQNFYEDIGEKRKARLLLIRLLITKYLFLVFFLFAWAFRENDFGADFAQLGCITLGIKIAEIAVKKYKIKWRKYAIRALMLIGGLVLCIIFGSVGEVITLTFVWICITKWVYEKLRNMHSIRARMLIGGLFLCITLALVSAYCSGDGDDTMLVMPLYIYIFESVYEMLRDMRRYSLSQKPGIVEFAFESDFKDSEFQETSMDSIAFDDIQYPKGEEHHPDKASQKEDIQSRQETLQREPSFMSVDEGMLLVLDIPIQRDKISLDKVIVSKDVVKLPLSGKNIQIDVSSKKVKVIQEIDFEHCKRYDIKKGNLVYALVAMVEYCINIWSKEWDDNTESACEKLTVQLNQKLNPYGIKTRLSKRGWQFLENNVLITFEDAIYLLNSKRI